MFSLVPQNCTRLATSRNTGRNGMHSKDSERTHIHVTESRRYNVNLFETPKTNEHFRQRGKPRNGHTRPCAKLLNKKKTLKNEHAPHANFVAPMVTKQHHRNNHNEPQRPNAKTTSTDNEMRNSKRKCSATATLQTQILLPNRAVLSLSMGNLRLIPITPQSMLCVPPETNLPCSPRTHD